jgi:hypothetical protein
LRIIKRILLVILILLLIFSAVLLLFGKKKVTFTETADGHLISSSGVEYVFVSDDPSLTILGYFGFEGAVEGEAEFIDHSDTSLKTGMYAPWKDKAPDTLFRFREGSNDFSVYRKASLPPADFSADGCTRLEYFAESLRSSEAVKHISCGEGIADRAQIDEFLSDIRSQPQKEGFPIPLFSYSYPYGSIYGYFSEEDNLALQMRITIHGAWNTSDDKPFYSVSLDGKEYLLPDKWLELFGIQ